METVKINVLLYGKLSKQISSFITRTLLYTMILTVVTAFCLHMPLYGENYTNFYKNSSYDYLIQETSKTQIEALKKETFVEGIFAFSLMIFRLDKRVNAVANDGRDIALLATSSFDGLKYSSFADTNMISLDQTILSDEACNPIIIDYSLSKTEGISVGDTFSLLSERAFHDKEKNFTVGAIYQNHCEFANYDAVILMNEHVNNDILQLDSSAGNSLAYVKANNLSDFEEYLKEKFYPQLSFSSLSDFRTLPTDVQESYYQLRTTRLEQAEQDLDFSNIARIVVTAVGFILLIILMKREMEKCLENKMYTIAVLYVLGMNRHTLLMKMIMKSFLPVSFSVVFACLLNKYVVFQYLTEGIYVPWRQIIILGLLCLAVIFAVFLILSIVMTAKKITPETVLEQIDKEKRMS